MNKLILAVMVFFAFIAQGQTMEFESKTIDYGIIEHNSNGNREFKFTNTGDKPLIIKSIKASCGCTVPSYKKEDGSTEWKPGERGTIKVKYATNRMGVFKRTIVVMANNSNHPIILTIQGEVIKNK